MPARRPCARGSSKGTGALAETLPKPSKLVRKLALKAARRLGQRALAASGEALREAVENARVSAEHVASSARELVQSGKTGANGRLPIQRAIDVAVPVRVAWEEWVAVDSLPEGVHTVTDLERDGSALSGRIAGPNRAGWAAEILDEREGESFAWQSHGGSDCAGLVTFHALSDRLTRIELNLDVVPVGFGDAVQLTTHRADRKAEIDLRRFKARVELINPDLYEEAGDDGDEARESPPTADE